MLLFVAAEATHRKIAVLSQLRRRAVVGMAAMVETVETAGTAMTNIMARVIVPTVIGANAPVSRQIGTETRRIGHR